MGITGTTGLVCILGNPAKHSKSPIMHNAAFTKLGLDYRYLAFEVDPGRFNEAVCGLKAMGFKGCNLTMPFKESIIPLLDEVSAVAKITGSCNTVLNKDGKLYGTSTDGIGFYDSLRFEENYDYTGKKMVLLGSGGAAKAVAAEGALSGLKELCIFRRKGAKWDAALEFVERLSKECDCKCELLDIEDKELLASRIKETDLLVNATNVGMGDDPNSLIDPEMLHSDLFVADIIYHPLETKLLADAKAKGARTMNGLNMLIYQGAAAFKIWTGCEMPVEEVKKAMFG